MRTYDLIHKKRDGESLSQAEIEFLVKGYVQGQIPDYQMSALMMAIYFKGLSREETIGLTQAMIRSGDTIDLNAIQGIKVDKHSTGGVGDKTTIVLGPMVAAAGAKVAKMSGRGLGHTGGTIDKLESFRNFKTEISQEEFIRWVNQSGIAIAGQSGNLVPADKKLYALRDVTATVENMSLIASSVMSKKLAAGADAIVLDVKCGEGAFMKNEKDAFDLAGIMVEIGQGMGKQTVALVTDMRQPLGNNIGNSLEVIEAIQTLKGEGPDDLTELCLELGSNMLVLAKVAEDVDAARAKLKAVIQSGQAIKKLEELVEQQGGDADQVRDITKLPVAAYQMEVKATRAGYIQSIDAEEIGLAAMLLGAGRATKDDVIDYGAGVVLKEKVGNKVAAGQVLAVLHYNNDAKLDEAARRLSAAYVYTNDPVETTPLVLGKVAQPFPVTT